MTGFSETALNVAELALHEAALFAAAGFLVLGLGDLLVDLIWFFIQLRRKSSGDGLTTLEDLPQPRRPGAMAVFVPAWDEAAVIAPMLRHALAAFGAGDYRIYVGCYPNDPETIAAVHSVLDPRVRVVVGEAAGPTTKADCLNRLWRAMEADERDEGRRFKAVVLHDAEDVVHSAELTIFDTLVERHALVQLPVLPLIDPNSRWVAGHYADEFAQSHGKELVVRAAIGAALPSAGVGCAFERKALGRIAEQRGGLPFDADSLTEDYELGLRLAAAGGSGTFVRMRAEAGRPLVMTREYFPGTLDAAVAQKARWITGIALAGWDRLGWSGGAAERWMRLRDRQSLLAALLLLVGYGAALLWLAVQAGALATGWTPAPVPPALAWLLAANGCLLVWRLAVRWAFVTRAYGPAEGLRAVPRALIGNMIAILAARRALGRYLGQRRSGRPRWDKTSHSFPAIVPAE